MPGRAAALVGTLALIGVLGYLTVSVLIRDGFDILVGTSLFMLAMFSFGIIGALINSPRE